MCVRKTVSYGEPEWDIFPRCSSFSWNGRKPLEFLSHSRRTRAVNVIHCFDAQNIILPTSLLKIILVRSECYRSYSNHGDSRKTSKFEMDKFCATKNITAIGAQTFKETRVGRKKFNHERLNFTEEIQREKTSRMKRIVIISLN